MDSKPSSAANKIITHVHLNGQDILLYSRNTLSPSTKELIDSHLAICNDCRTRLNLATQIAYCFGNPTGEERADTFFYKHRVSTAIKGFWRKFRALLSMKPVWAFAPVALLLFIGLGVFLSLPVAHIPGFDRNELTRNKGLLPYINIYKKNGETIELLKDFSVVEEKNNVQLSYIACNMKYGVIFSFDANGYLTMHHPAESGPEATLALENEGEIFLSHSFILDNAPVFERFFFITSENNFSKDNVVNAAKKLTTHNDKGITGLLELPSDFAQSSITLLKKRN